MKNEIITGVPEIPTLEEIKLGVDELLKHDWNSIKYKKNPKAYYKQINSLLISKLKVLPFATLKSSTSTLNTPCFRIRKLDSKLDASIISEFSHPPISLTKKFQRANLPNHPVFYCSPDLATSLIETIRDSYNKNDENIFFVSEWLFRPDYTLNVVPFLYGNMSDKNIFKKIGENVFENFKREFPKVEGEKIEVIKAILEFLSGLFVFENVYTVSSFIGHSYLYAEHNFRADVFIYPSTQTQRHTVNFAIHPNTVMEKMFLKKIYCLKIKDFTLVQGGVKEDIHYHSDFEFLRVGNNESGIIMWRQWTEDDAAGFKKQFSESIQ